MHNCSFLWSCINLFLSHHDHSITGRIPLPCCHISASLSWAAGNSKGGWIHQLLFWCIYLSLICYCFLGPHWRCFITSCRISLGIWCQVISPFLLFCGYFASGGSIPSSLSMSSTIDIWVPKYPVFSLITTSLDWNVSRLVASEVYFHFLRIYSKLTASYVANLANLIALCVCSIFFSITFEYR